MRTVLSWIDALKFKTKESRFRALQTLSSDCSEWIQPIVQTFAPYCKPMELLRLSVTRLGDLLHFGHVFKAWGNNYFAQISHILGKFCKVDKIFHFFSEIFFGNYCRHLATFYWSHCYWRTILWILQQIYKVFRFRSKWSDVNLIN